jgi:hypothetical protein
MTAPNIDRVEIHAPDGPFLLIVADDGEELVRVDRDLSLTFGPSYDPDDAAKRFWDAFAVHAHDPAPVTD